MDNIKGQIVESDLRDVTMHLQTEMSVAYNDDELVIIEDLKALADLSARKVKFNIVAVCISGRMNLDVAGETTSTHAGQIIICHSNVLLSNFMVSPDFECKVMCISDRLQRSILQTQAAIWNKKLYSQHICILDVNPDDFGIYNELRNHWNKKDSPFKHEIVVSLLRVAYLGLCEMLMNIDEDSGQDDEPENMSHMDVLFHRFLDNISRRRVKKLSVSEYADELCITPKYLSTICRTISGKSPTDWISEHVVADIVHYLRNTDLSAKEIGEELGFANASFFGKYVRQHLGVSPNEYRRKLLEIKE
mgnify:FL=1